MRICISVLVIGVPEAIFATQYTKNFLLKNEVIDYFRKFGNLFLIYSILHANEKMEGMNLLQCNRVRGKPFIKLKRM